MKQFSNIGNNRLIVNAQRTTLQGWIKVNILFHHIKIFVVNISLEIAEVQISCIHKRIVITSFFNIICNAVKRWNCLG